MKSISEEIVCTISENNFPLMMKSTIAESLIIRNVNWHVAAAAAAATSYQLAPMKPILMEQLLLASLCQQQQQLTRPSEAENQ